MRYHEIITERFLNLVGVDSINKKQRYVDQVWDVLEDSYSYAGGLAVGGINSKEDLIRIPFWKLVVRNGVVHGVVLYKDKNGRKSIAAGTDGSDYGKKKVAEIMLADILEGRSYSEKSKASLGFVMKRLPREIWDQVLIEPERAQTVLNREVTPISDVPRDQWPKDAELTINKYPELIDYGYIRTLGGSGMDVFKVMLGSPYNKIT